MASNCVLIGDIKRSRDVENWSTLFKKLEGTLNEINKMFSEDIIIDFKPTVGDEFQGVLKNPKNAYVIYVSIKSRLPVDFYCGVGIGDIERPLEEEVGMRGTAFYRARSALELCKKSNRNLLIKSSDTTIQTDEILNTLLRFIEVLENSWTERQREVVNYVRLHPGSTYEQVGKHFKISRQAVSQILGAADWAAISEGEALLNNLLGSLN
ncbi:MAG: SatD family protein [archaeon]|nr:SatD family protein [archaeon]